MANPNLNNNISVYAYSHSIKFTNTSAQNVLANTNNSGKLIKATIYIWNYGTSPATMTIEQWSAAGTPLCNDTGVTATAYGSTATGGSSLGGPPLSIPVNAGLNIIEKYSLNENKSLVFTASQSNTLAVWLDWTVLG